VNLFKFVFVTADQMKLPVINKLLTVHPDRAIIFLGIFLIRPHTSPKIFNYI
jgi:hypothetical protein